jgi:serine/threonine protein kinase
MIREASAPAARTASEDGYRVGSKIGRYRLVALIASGGMAHVWAAEPETSGGISRTVAIKVIRPELTSDPEYSKLFIDEATIATAVHHPNVCETYELERHNNVLFMAMEWVPGDSLAGLIRVGNRFWPLEPSIGAKICADACAGLHAAHEATDGEGKSLGVIHRDVSPANILVSLSGQVKVSDFGVAKARHQLHERTRTGEVKGKFGYLAPEQISGDPTDRRADIYALGCVLYTATLGLRPFGNGPEAMPKILLGEFKRPTEIDPTYPAGLEAIVLRALEQKPANRFASADEMREALETWLWNERLQVTQADIAKTVKERIPQETQNAIRRIQTQGRSKSDIAYEILKETLDLMEPPTAATGVVVPEEIRARVRSSSPRGLSGPSSGPTRKFDVEPIAASIRERNTEVETYRAPPERSGSYRTPHPQPQAESKRGQSGVKESSARNSPTPTQNNAPLWLGAAGLVCLILSIGLWFFLKQ